MAELMSMATMLLFLLLITQFSITTAQRNDSLISLGSSLSPGTNKSYWLSNSGQFAFGFYQQGDGFAVGIWFEKMEEKTVVWTAKRDDPPLPQDTTLLLSGDGRLFLQDEQGRQEHISNASQLAASASMLDSGNFVLYNSNSTIIWQSFDSPTDTLLPGQRLVPQEGRNRLISSVSETNHSSGRFQLVMQSDGNLVQYPVLSIGLLPSHHYWNTETYKAGDNVTLNLDPNGWLYLLNSTGSNIKNISDAGRSHLGKNVLYRMIIDVNGLLRLYSHSMVQNDDWVVEWVSTNNLCDPTGLCGLNSYCDLNGQGPYCVCLPGFDFVDQDQKGLGCERNSSTYGCGTKNDERVTFEELTGIAWEENSYSVVSLDNKNACLEECSRDCNCEIALFQNQQCSKKKIPLQFGKTTQGIVLITTIIKVHSGEVGARKGRNEHGRTGILISGIAISTFGLIALVVSGILVCRFRMWEYKRIGNHGSNKFLEDVTLRPYAYAELEKATNGFTDQRLERVIADGEREFRNEMKVIGKTHHKNLVKLLGYCHEGTSRLLVYEYMTNGSLADFLFRSETKPTWEERNGIVLNIAKGILYLHEECETQIIHCDIKPENILMDEQNCAKIADFGLAKLLMPDQSRTYTGFRGTRGYVAPEWHRNMPITVQADVYSFGIVLLEIVCCRRSVEMDVPEDKVILANWVYDCFLDGELDKLVEDEDAEKIEVEKMMKLGLWCIQEEPSVRPSMKKVCLMMEGTIEVPPPPNPTSSVSIVQIE
ncbi:hypothetical protein TIFTF001_038393 [Ficus carica]|uniref:Receptor-like serine/threonine-protein kinase n=1 Tax=Ficus carica TaxID=3494 RepID=A0AA88EBF1_FICCA|nr:hypothetical protein TIFTF001_038393 [Ficus carica]